MSDDIFNINDHFDFRNDRYSKIDKTNEKLLGLAIVEINPTELCNRTCSFCPRSDPSVYPNRNLNMTTGTAQLLVDQLLAAGFSGDIHVTGYGEPLLNPDILDIIKIFSQHFYVEIITNGDRLTNNHYTHEQLYHAGLNFLIVDCYDGDDQYDNFRKILSDSCVPYRIRKHYDNGNTDLIQIYNFNNRGGMLSKKSINRPCWLPFYKAFIDWNGDLGLCCNDWARKQIFGNIKQKTISKMWMSKQFIDIRKNLANGDRYKIKSCENCNTKGTLQGKESVEVWKKQL